jgi:ferritin-like metal-binding protein YciE
VPRDGSAGIGEDGEEALIDAALIGAAQRVEHYEIAAYGTVRAVAEQLGHKDVVRLLQKTLDEEGAADKKLTAIAEDEVLRWRHRPAERLRQSERDDCEVGVCWLRCRQHASFVRGGL